MGYKLDTILVILDAATAMQEQHGIHRNLKRDSSETTVVVSMGFALQVAWQFWGAYGL